MAGLDLVVLDGRAVVVANNRMIDIDGTAIEIANGQGLQIVSNSINSAILGISLDGNSFDNVIRENAITGCTASACPIVSNPDFCVHTAGNTSAGNNFLPSAGM
jgi:hypothetical protein